MALAPWAVSGGREGITAPLGLLCQCAHLPGLYPREMYRPTSTRAPPLPGATLEDCSLGEEQSWLTLSRVLWPLLGASSALLPGGAIP